MEKLNRRRLRSASVQLGALTALALTLTACNGVDDDDDDCALAPTGGAPVAAVALRMPDTATASRSTSAELAAPVPDRGGFGTHLASCGG